jgi:hypothetical protein
MRLATVKFSRRLARVEREMDKVIAAINENRIAPSPGRGSCGRQTSTRTTASTPPTSPRWSGSSAGSAVSLQPTGELADPVKHRERGEG